MENALLHYTSAITRHESLLTSFLFYHKTNSNNTSKLQVRPFETLEKYAREKSFDGKLFFSGRYLIKVVQYERSSLKRLQKPPKCVTFRIVFTLER
jgi:hypothetical protein